MFPNTATSGSGKKHGGRLSAAVQKAFRERAAVNTVDDLRGLGKLTNKRFLYKKALLAVSICYFMNAFYKV